MYLIRRSDGAVLWRLGGKRSDFTFDPGARFAWQHDGRLHPDGELTVFDNEAVRPSLRRRSRALLLRLDEQHRRVRLVRSYSLPDSCSLDEPGERAATPRRTCPRRMGIEPAGHGVRPPGTHPARPDLRRRGRQLVPCLPLPLDRPPDGRACRGRRPREQSAPSSTRAGTGRPRLPPGVCWPGPTAAT